MSKEMREQMDKFKNLLKENLHKRDIPTAEDFAWNETDFQTILAEMNYQEVYDLMKKFAKFHVQNALEEAAEKAEGELVDTNGFPDVIIDKQSILTAYNLDNIK